MLDHLRKADFHFNKENIPVCGYCHSAIELEREWSADVNYVTESCSCCGKKLFAKILSSGTKHEKPKEDELVAILQNLDPISFKLKG